MIKFLRVVFSYIFAMLGIFAGALVASTQAAQADHISHPVAVFSGLDKITGRTIAFQAAIGETVQFGSLQITERACYTRPATEAPQTTSFVEVDDVDPDKKYRRIFSGWMFAASPGLHGIEHPIYDVWLTSCAGDEPGASANAGEGNEVSSEPSAVPRNSEPGAAPPPPPSKKHRKTKIQPAAVDSGPADAFAPMGDAVEVAPPPGQRKKPVKKPRPPAPAQDTTQAPAPQTDDVIPR